MKLKYYLSFKQLIFFFKIFCCVCMFTWIILLTISELWHSFFILLVSFFMLAYMGLIISIDMVLFFFFIIFRLIFFFFFRLKSQVCKKKKYILLYKKCCL